MSENRKFCQDVRELFGMFSFSSFANKIVIKSKVLQTSSLAELKWFSFNFRTIFVALFRYFQSKIM